MTQKPPGAAPPPRTRSIRSINKPATDDVVLVAGYDAGAQTGTIVVECDVDELEVVHVVAWIKPIGMAYTVPDTINFANPIPDGGFELTQVASTSTYRKTDSPITGLAANPAPTANNRRTYVAGYKANGDRVGATESAPFVAMPPVVQAEVNAHRCLWLTYAEGLAIGAFGETTSPTDDYLPLALPLAPDVASVGIEVLSGLWRHDPDASTETGAEGRPGTEQPLDPAHQDKYRNATLLSDHIQSATLRLNRLVALWKYADHNENTNELDAVTTTPFDVPTAPRPTHLCLGFHDGFEWSNNQGAVQVRISWQV